MDILIFRLYAPLASWGEIAVGESRHTANYPSKSALIGLLGAALGVGRDDEEQQRQLQHGYAFAVELFTAGGLLRDYHTAQVPDSVGKFAYRTRRDELVLGKERLGTILSSREYRTDTLALVAVRALADAPYTLTEIREKLLKPVFHLYLGRKSCPLAAPLNPQLLSGQPNYFAAFKAYQHKPLLPTFKTANAGGLSERDFYWLGEPKDRHYYWEGAPEDFSDTLDLTRRQTRIRHDQPLSRKRWQFAPRQEHYLFQGG
jgi:CRISPR system Cascade subunit CasD